jgi:AAA domain (dynein-related subfamily)
MTKKEELIQMRDNATDQDVKALFQEAIDREEIKEGTANQQVIANTLTQISKIISNAQVSKSTIDDTAVERIVKTELANAKIGLSNLDANVTSLLQGQKINATITILGASGTMTTFSTQIDPEFLTRPLTQLILSDVVAKNNVYLYGGAGTGKTYTAGEIASLLGWKLVEVNCNQFTSPLDLLGGQTISGYQEGLVSQAWSNEVDGTKVSGCVLLLDELPKIDPNTAGILNSALAKVKLEGDRAKITNGRGQKLEKGNLIIIGTGNTKLNETSEDYEANFKQDLSLQDRFAGSTYEIFIYYKTEVETTMKGFLFIWLYLVKLREQIEAKRLQGRAFVSIRLMESLRDSYKIYRTYDEVLKSASGTPLISQPKSLQQACESFFSLFPRNVADELKNITDYNGFKTTIAEKNMLPLPTDYPSSPMNFDTPQEVADANAIALANDQSKSQIYNA